MERWTWWSAHTRHDCICRKTFRWVRTFSTPWVEFNLLPNDLNATIALEYGITACLLESIQEFQVEKSVAYCACDIEKCINSRRMTVTLFSVTATANSILWNQIAWCIMCIALCSYLDLHPSLPKCHSSCPPSIRIACTRHYFRRWS